MIVNLIYSHAHPSVLQFSSIYKEGNLFADLAVIFQKMVNENTSPTPWINLIVEKDATTLCNMNDELSGAES